MVFICPPATNVELLPATRPRKFGPKADQPSPIAQPAGSSTNPPWPPGRRGVSRRTRRTRPQPRDRRRRGPPARQPAARSDPALNQPPHGRRIPVRGRAGRPNPPCASDSGWECSPHWTQRIAVRCHIGGMSAGDTADYIGHHCKIAGRQTPCSPTTRSGRSRTPPVDIPARSTTSPCTRSPPRSPPITPSSARKPPAPPSPKSQQTESDQRRLDHHPVNANTTPSSHPPRPRSPHRAGPFSCPDTCQHR